MIGYTIDRCLQERGSKSNADADTGAGAGADKLYLSVYHTVEP